MVHRAAASMGALAAPSMSLPGADLDNPVLERFYQRAKDRVDGSRDDHVCFDAVLKRVRPGSHTQMWEYLAEKVGLAITYGLVDSDADGLK